MHIAIVGAGAMGCLFGAATARAGFETTLLDVSPDVVQHLNADGVRVVIGDQEERFPVRATVDSSGAAKADMALFTVKSQHTMGAAERFLPLLDEASAIVSLQNGWGHHVALGRYFAPEQVALGVTYNSATSRAPGCAVHTGFGDTIVGSLSGSPRAPALVADVLSMTTLPVRVAESVQDEIWKKLVVNAAILPTAALASLSMGQLSELELPLQLVDDLASEAVGVARASGFAVDLDERVSAIHALLENGGDGKVSMLQDFEANRPTEVDAITGAIVAEAAAHRIDVPLHRAMLALIRGRERASR